MRQTKGGEVKHKPFKARNGDTEADLLKRSVSAYNRREGLRDATRIIGRQFNNAKELLESADGEWENIQCRLRIFYEAKAQQPKRKARA